MNLIFLISLLLIKSCEGRTFEKYDEVTDNKRDSIRGKHAFKHVSDEMIRDKVIVEEILPDQMLFEEVLISDEKVHSKLIAESREFREHMKMKSARLNEKDPVSRRESLKQMVLRRANGSSFSQLGNGRCQNMPAPMEDPFHKTSSGDNLPLGLFIKTVEECEALCSATAVCLAFQFDWTCRLYDVKATSAEHNVCFTGDGKVGNGRCNNNNSYMFFSSINKLWKCKKYLKPKFKNHYGGIAAISYDSGTNVCSIYKKKPTGVSNYDCMNSNSSNNTPPPTVEPSYNQVGNDGRCDDMPSPMEDPFRKTSNGGNLPLGVFIGTSEECRALCTATAACSAFQFDFNYNSCRLYDVKATSASSIECHTGAGKVGHGECNNNNSKTHLLWIDSLSDCKEFLDPKYKDYWGGIAAISWDDTKKVCSIFKNVPTDVHTYLCMNKENN